MKQFTRYLLATLVAVNSTMSYGAGKIQNQDVKSEAELTGAGATKASLINDSKIYVTGNGINDRLDTAINNGLIGGGGGSKNYLGNGVVASNGAGSPNPGNGDFEKNSTSGWSLAHSAISSNILTSVASAGTAFSSSAGGTAAAGTLSMAIVSASQLQKKYSLNYASSAASTAGDMLISNAFFIDDADKGKMMQIKFPYKVNSGTVNMSGTSANTFSIWIYDVDGAAWIQPQGVYNIIQTSGIGNALATFQTTFTGTKYQLALVNNTASSGAFSLYVDDFSVGPQTQSMGPAVGDWVQYTPTFTGFGTPSNVAFYSRRVGDSLEIRGNFTSGTATAVTAQITLGYNGVNGGVTSSSAIAANTMVGKAAVSASSTTYFSESVLAQPSSGVINIGVQTSTSNELTAANGNVVSGGTGNISIFAKVPIQGWSSNTVQSQDTDTRVVAATLQNSSTTINSTSQTNISWTSATVDTHSGFNGTTTYTAPVSGQYDISWTGSIVIPAGAGSATATFIISINGSGACQTNSFVNSNVGSGNASPFAIRCIRTLKAGDTVIASAATNNAIANTTLSTPIMSIQRLSGPAVVQASESVGAHYSGNPSFSPTLAVGTESAIILPTKNLDSHNAYNTSTGVYVVPVSGTYSMECLSLFTGSFPSQGNIATRLKVNGTAIQTRSSTESGGSAGQMSSAASLPSYPLKAGDSITCTIQSSGYTTLSASSGATLHMFSIARVGN